MVHDEALADQPADRDAVLEQRVHPRIRVRVVRWRRSINRVAAGVRRHRHHRHAVGQPPVDRLEILVIERLLPHDGGERADQILIGNRPVRLDPRLRVLVVLAAEPHEQMGHRLSQPVVLFLVPLLQLAQLPDADRLQPVGRGAESIGLRVVHGPHVGFGHGGNRSQDALLPASGTGAIA